MEGIHIFYRQEIAARCDLKIFVQLDADLCLLRRLRRDMAQRGRTLDSVARQYEATVKPMYEKYVRNYAPLADLVVPTVRENDLAVEILAQHINRRRRRRPAWPVRTRKITAADAARQRRRLSEVVETALCRTPQYQLMSKCRFGNKTDAVKFARFSKRGGVLSPG